MMQKVRRNVWPIIDNFGSDSLCDMETSKRTVTAWKRWINVYKKKEKDEWDTSEEKRKQKKVGKLSKELYTY